MLIKRTVVVLAVAATVLGGCGGTKDEPAATPVSASAAGSGIAALTGAEIVAKAKDALVAAKSFHVKGEVADEGQKTAIDFRSSGADVIGSMTFGGAKVDLLKVAGTQYMKGDKKFWETTTGNAKQAATVLTVLGERWVKIPAGNKDFEGLFSVTDVASLLKAEGTVTKGAVKAVDGKQAIALQDKGAEGGTLYVATEGEPYPLRIDGPNAADGGLTFSEFGATFADIKAPAAADAIDLSKLKG